MRSSGTGTLSKPQGFKKNVRLQTPEHVRSYEVSFRQAFFGRLSFEPQCLQRRRFVPQFKPREGLGCRTNRISPLVDRLNAARSQLL